MLKTTDHFHCHSNLAVLGWIGLWQQYSNNFETNSKNWSIQKEVEGLGNGKLMMPKELYNQLLQSLGWLWLKNYLLSSNEVQNLYQSCLSVISPRLWLIFYRGVKKGRKGWLFFSFRQLKNNLYSPFFDILVDFLGPKF